MLADFHIHYTPEKAVKKQLGDSNFKLYYTQGIPSYSFHPKLYDLEGLVQALAEAKIDVGFLSSGAGLEGDLETCIWLNNDLKEQEEKFQARVRGLAHVPPLAGPPALRELERGVRELGFKGAAIASNIAGTGLDSKLFWPFYEKVEELGVFLFIHPSLALQQPEYYNAYDLARSVGREFDLVVSLVRLINGGVFDAFPALRVVMSHLGGGISALMGRVLSYQEKEFWGTKNDPVHGKAPKKPFLSYFKQIFLDTGGVIGDVEAVKFALVKFPNQLVFGSDYPQEIRSGADLKKFVGELQKQLSPEQFNRLHDNYARVVGGA